MTTPSWSALRDALSRLREDGRPIRFWLRDDDAVAPSAALDQLLAATGEVPLALAVIPGMAEPALAEKLNPLGRVTVLQHGFSHTNHAAAGTKKCELGAERPAAVVLAELAEGRRRLAAFEQVAEVLVPPWNRIAEPVAAGLPALGVKALSVYGDRRPDAPGPLRVNTHVDPIDWHGGRGFLGEEAVLGQVLARLQRLQTGAADRDEPTGILTHHLVHDKACLGFIENLLSAVAQHPDCHWHSIETLLGLEATKDNAGAP